jgi:hypothetical protein
MLCTKQGFTQPSSTKKVINICSITSNRVERGTKKPLQPANIEDHCELKRICSLYGLFHDVASKRRAKLSRCLINYHSTKTYGGVEVFLCIYKTSTAALGPTNSEVKRWRNEADHHLHFVLGSAAVPPLRHGTWSNCIEWNDRAISD